MQKLHLVGITTDHRGLIFSVRRGAKSGGYVIQLDDALINAVEELRALLGEEAGADADSRASARPQSALSVREVQARLRRGRTIEQVAREAGVEPSWVSRFAVPVLAEQAEVIRAARATRMAKSRIGLSGAPLGESVYRNLAERGVFEPREELDKAWRARQLTEGMWLVTFKYSSRGHDSTATWEYDETTGTLRSRGRVATLIGFREPRRTPKAAAVTRAPKKSASKKTSTTTTARQSSSRQATKRVAAARRAAAARMVSEAEKATRRNAAVARKALKNPVVIPPRRVEEPPDAENAVEPLLVDEPLEEPKGWGQELELEWDDTRSENDAAEAEHHNSVEDRDEHHDPLEGQVHPYEEVAVVDEPEPEPEPEAEPEPGFVVEEEPELDVETEAEFEPASARVVRRREPLRARPRLGDGMGTAKTSDDESPAERARRRVRVRSAVEPDDASSAGNGPVFRGDLTQQAHEISSFPRSAVGRSPEPPLSMPLQPIEPPPRRRRLRPLRGR